jgi:hypothetical protein
MDMVVGAGASGGGRKSATGTGLASEFHAMLCIKSTNNVVLNPTYINLRYVYSNFSI